MSASPPPRRPRARPTPLLWVTVAGAVSCAVVAGVVGRGPVAGAAFAGLVIAVFVLVAAAGGLPRGTRGRRAVGVRERGPRPAGRDRPMGDADADGLH